MSSCFRTLFGYAKFSATTKMPWAVVPKFLDRTFDHGIIYKFGSDGSIVQARTTNTLDDFIHITKGLLNETASEQPLDVYTYGVDRWPIQFKPKRTIDLERRYQGKMYTV